MSSVYVLEPPTKGKVVLHTTMGALDVELWPKEAPKAVRNFVQLCVDDYYKETVFHRVIKGFLVQGGDPTASGTGGESIYGAPFADEFHSRLKFNHRGLVACANAGKPHSNGSQFFITLDRCDWLDRKNTIFGKVTGDSIYNLLRLGEVETDKDDRPMYPPKILSIEVLWNPFDDVVPRQLQSKPSSDSSKEVKKQDQNKKAVRQLNVLSFGEEVEEEEMEATIVKDKIKSIHDVLDDPRFLKEEPKAEELTQEEVEKKKELQRSVRDALAARKGDENKHSESGHPKAYDLIDDNDSDDGDESSFDARMRLQILKRRQDMGDTDTRVKSSSDKASRRNRETSPPRRRDDDDDDGDDDDSKGQNPKVDKLSLKKKGIGSEARAERMAKADTDMELLNNAEQERHMKKQKKRRLQGREVDTLARLEKFRSSLFAKETTTAPKDDKDDISGWQASRLHFPEATQKDPMARKDDPNSYVVHDPLLEKGKEKFNQMQAKSKRREREWAGRSLT